MRLTNNPEVTTIRQVEVYHLRDGIEIEIQALPPDYDDTVEAELPSPVAARLGVETDGKGRPVLDDRGRTIMRYDVEDADYKKAVSRNGKLQAIKMFVDGLGPGQIAWEATLDNDGPAFYNAVQAELKAFGFSMGDLLGAVKAIGVLSGISDEDMKAAEEDFTRAEN